MSKFRDIRYVLKRMRSDGNVVSVATYKDQRIWYALGYLHGLAENPKMYAVAQRIINRLLGSDKRGKILDLGGIER